VLADNPIFRENLIAGAEPGWSSHLTLCWRKPDSNPRSLSKSRYLSCRSALTGSC